ncbi:MAG: hypothetical protein ABUL60_22425 [Myxococcales bacterium]
MSAPRRWLETEQASAEALELLRAGRPPQRMNEAVRSRSRRRVAGLAMLPAAAGMLAAWPQLALGALLGTVGTVAVMSAFSAFSAPPAPAPSALPASPSASHLLRADTPPPATDEPETRSVDDPTPMPAGSARRPSVSPVPVASDSAGSAARGEGLQQEIQLLEQARRQLSSEPAQAERVLREHEARFAAGQLRSERELLLIDALVRLGRRSEAEARARVLRRQAPTSLYGERLEQILGRSGSDGKPDD